MLVRLQGIVHFKIDGASWTLDLREGEGKLTRGEPADAADIELTISDPDFVKMVRNRF